MSRPIEGPRQGGASAFDEAAGQVLINRREEPIEAGNGVVNKGTDKKAAPKFKSQICFEIGLL
jgi:hypothetical protein